MISMMMFLLSLFTGKQVQERPIDNVHHDTYSVAALADGMTYYQGQAIQKCWQAGTPSCSSGQVPLSSRTGSQVDSAYGSGYETVTDGSTYIATTLDAKGAVAARTHQESDVNSGVFAALMGMTSGSSAVGYYDQTAGGVVLPEKGDETVIVRFSRPMIQGQPVIYSTIATASPPVQLASIAGGGFSPLVPLPPTITPIPVYPEAVVSPPASVSPPDVVSPIYTPAAAIVVNPVSPWAPSPVLPPAVAAGQVSLVVSGTQTNYDVRSHLVSDLGWDQVTPLNVNVIVSSGAIIGSTSTAAYAMTIGVGFPAGMEFTLTNQGYIVGKGGDGGGVDGGCYTEGCYRFVGGAAGPGNDGGPALYIGTETRIVNDGVIGGGGGGGSGYWGGGSRTRRYQSGGPGAGFDTGGWHGGCQSPVSTTINPSLTSGGGCQTPYSILTGMFGGGLGSRGEGYPYNSTSSGNYNSTPGNGGHSIDGLSLISCGAATGQILGTMD